MPDVDYLVINDSEVEPGAPILSTLGVRWRDNAIAIAQGASGAPRIQNAAIPVNEISDTKLQQISNTKLQLYSAGTGNILFRQSGESSTFDGSFSDLAALRVDRNGTIRCSAQQRATNDSSILQVLKNGSTEQQWTTSSSNFQTRTVNVSVSPGDTLLIRHRSSTVGGGSSVVQNAEFTTSNTNVLLTGSSVSNLRP